MSKKVKRYGDIIISGIALVLTFPLMIVIAAVIKLDSKGPILFKQKRLGYKGKSFVMYKFRTMVVGAEKMGTGLFNYKNDQRVTKVGRILRNTSLDELPQIFNILKGEMSIVGPRPCVSYELGDYDTLNSRYKNRFTVLPGITGLAQVCGRNDNDWDEKVNYDNEYIKRFKREGCILDIKIIFKTICNIFLKKNIYENKFDENMEDEESAKVANDYVIMKAHEKEN